MPEPRKRQAASPAAAPSRLNIVRGRVELAGSAAPAGGLVIRIFDVVPGRAAGAGAVRRPLGSTVTRASGSFELTYDDEQFGKSRTDGSRPDILVTIAAPEARGAGAGPMFEAEVRQSAGRDEFFLMHVELEEFTKRKLPVAAMSSAAITDPAMAGAAAAAEQERQSLLRDQLATVRRKAVTEARTIEREMEEGLRDRVITHVTGVTPGTPQWQRFVPPGEDAPTVAKAYQQTAIRDQINPAILSGTRTYLVLSQDERDALGTPPDAARVEARLRLRTSAPTLLREDPMALACSKRRTENPATPPVPPTPSPGTDPVTTGGTVDEKLADLVASIRPPEELSLGGLPDQTAVATNIANLKLSKGPADVPAFYDFHDLQMAFDHVWEDARADGYVERAKAMYRAATDMGGDPKAALDGAKDPLRALSKEVALTRAASARYAPVEQAASYGTTVMARRAGDGYTGRPGVDGGIYLPPDWPDPPPQPPPQPPKPWPPHTGPWADQVSTWPEMSVDVGSYPFTVFAANSVNFGVLLTYRQCWEPLNYQVGRLVGTRTLAPKESISITTREVVKSSHNAKQVQDSQQLRRDEAEDTQRDEAEIVARAQTKTNFALTTKGSYDLGPLGEGDATTSFGRDSDTSSQETKKAMRTATRKAAHEYRNSHRLELESAGSTENETTEKREINNPNDELALTYIFYELQRRYRVSERLFRAVPVALVAQHVPRPEQINETWAIRHDWIIKRFLPDDSFKDALLYLSTRATGDRIILDELRTNMTTLRAIVERLNVEIGVVRAEAAAQVQSLQGYVERKAAIEQNEHGEGGFESAWEWAAGADEESRDAIRILEEGARERLEKALRDERDLRARLDREATALQVATDTYTKAYAEHSNQRVQIDRLLRHLRDYILHYMQGIWSYEHPDQQFFRHHTLTAPRLRPLARTYTLTEVAQWPVGVVPQAGKKCYAVTFTTQVDDDMTGDQTATLAELVHLDRPLGYKGNYIIYPLKQSNALTDYMITPYLDADLGLRDPDSLGNWTLQEFSDYFQCLRRTLSAADFAEVEPILTAHYQQLLADPLRDGEEIIVPTKSLYMQMLVDSGKALEAFKEAHRLIDVMKAKSEVRATELDNLRRAKLLLGNRLDDPNVESVKNVFYHGDVPPHDGDE